AAACHKPGGSAPDAVRELLVVPWLTPLAQSRFGSAVADHPRTRFSRRAFLPQPTGRVPRKTLGQGVPAVPPISLRSCARQEGPSLALAHRNRTMKTRFAFGAAVLLLVAVATTASAQTLASDQSDYSPGSTAQLTGAGFQP